jgi:hypothetical protein
MVFLKVGIPVSTSSPTNIFDIPDMTIVIGTDIGQPATLCSNRRMLARWNPERR